MPVSIGRPTYHVVAERGWMNDPCAPGYDPSTGIFHLMYQWNPHSYIWNDISWGAATSKDMISWKYTASEPVLKPTVENSEAGIFTGCMYPTAPDGSPGLSIFYTSVTKLPIHWTLPHTLGAEGLSLISSSDGGKTWLRHPENPIIIGEPKHLAVTGFRDPAIFEWPALKERLGYSHYAVLSGGLQGEVEGPRMFLYGLDPTDLTKWTFLRTLGNFERNLNIDRNWSGDFGSNWECGTLFSLRHYSSGIERLVGIVGVEGGKTRPHAQAYAKANPNRPKRDPRYCNWFFANLTADDDISFDTTGMMDWGDWYAPNVFAHPDGRRIAWGWIVEQDISDELAKEKGWIGCLGIPRELTLGVYRGVTGTTKTPLNAITSIETAGDQVIVLSIRPLRELEKLRREVLYQSSSVTSGTLLDKTPHSYEILVRADISEEGTIALTIRESSQVKTTITFDSPQERLIVSRGSSTTCEDICLQDEVAPFTLFRYGDTYEQLELRVFVDKDVVEVFANERVAISTRVYSPVDACGISLEVDAPGTAEVKVWSMGSIGLQDG